MERDFTIEELKAMLAEKEKEEAEKKKKKLEAEKKEKERVKAARQSELDVAYKAKVEAEAKYEELKTAMLRDYGQAVTSYKSDDGKTSSERTTDWFTSMFNDMFGFNDLFGGV